MAAASGWFVARRTDGRQPGEQSPLTQAYRRGLNYLLEEKTDKALETMGKALSEDAESLEIQMALGNLYRRRGDVERAIEIHTRIRNHQDLAQDKKARANLELGLDFMRAGLFDRAETLFETLGGSTPYDLEAQQQLLLLYQQQNDWHRALGCILRWRQLRKPRHGETAAFFLCELAEEAMALHRLKDARDLLQEALLDDPGCVRATMARGRLEYMNGEYRQAFETLRGIEQQNPSFLAVVLPLIGHCADRLHFDEEYVGWLEDIHQRYRIMAAAIARADRLVRLRGMEAALNYLLPILEESPDPQALNHALGYLAQETHSSSRLSRLQTLLSHTLSGQEQFRCEHCGFESVALYWRCPSCRYWGAIRPMGPFSSLRLDEAES